VDSQLIVGEVKILHGQCIVSVDRELIVEEDKVLH
jgi:hypothetical protein